MPTKDVRSAKASIARAMSPANNTGYQTVPPLWETVSERLLKLVGIEVPCQPSQCSAHCGIGDQVHHCRLTQNAEAALEHARASAGQCRPGLAPTGLGKQTLDHVGYRTIEVVASAVGYRCKVAKGRVDSHDGKDPPYQGGPVGG